MKKIAGKIAMILILVMLANSFSGCTFMLPSIFGNKGGFVGDLKVLGLGALGFLIDLIIIGILLVGILAEAEPPSEAETGIYLVSAEYNPLTEYYSLMEKINSLPEMERVSLMEKINSLPETKRASLVRTINSLPKSEIASSIERLNILSETKFVSVVQTFNSLSEAEFDSLEDKLKERVNSLPKTVYAETMAFSHQKPYMGIRFCLQ